MKIKNLKINESAISKYIEKCQRREMILMYQSVGLVLVGGVATAATNWDDPLGLILMFGGIYSAAVATQYRDIVKSIIEDNTETKSKQHVKTKKDKK